MRFALLVLSDKAASGEREDGCLPAMRESLPPGAEVVAETILSDDAAAIAARLRTLADADGCDCVLTSGGTGLSPRDVTPQATASVCDYQVPGLAEAMRAASVPSVPTAMLSRAVAGVRKRTLIVNLPGNPRAVREMLEVISSVLPHAIDSLRGRVGDHAPGARR